MKTLEDQLLENMVKEIIENSAIANNKDMLNEYTPYRAIKKIVKWPAGKVGRWKATRVGDNIKQSLSILKKASTADQPTSFQSALSELVEKFEKTAIEGFESFEKNPWWRKGPTKKGMIKYEEEFVPAVKDLVRKQKKATEQLQTKIDTLISDARNFNLPAADVKQLENFKKHTDDYLTVLASSKPNPVEIYSMLGKAAGKEKIVLRKVAKLKKEFEEHAALAKKQKLERIPVVGKPLSGTLRIGERILGHYINLQFFLGAAAGALEVFDAKEWLATTLEEYLKNAPPIVRKEVLRMVRSGFLIEALSDFFAAGFEGIKFIHDTVEGVLSAGPDDKKTKQSIEVFVNTAAMLNVFTELGPNESFYKRKYQELLSTFEKTMSDINKVRGDEFESVGGFKAWIKSYIKTFADEIKRNSQNIKQDILNSAKGSSEKIDLVNTIFNYGLAQNVKIRYGIDIGERDITTEDMLDLIGNNLDKIPPQIRPTYQTWVKSKGTAPWSLETKLKLVLNDNDITASLVRAAETAETDLTEIVDSL